jgi:hypothetical protein
MGLAAAAKMGLDRPMSLREAALALIRQAALPPLPVREMLYCYDVVQKTSAYLDKSKSTSALFETCFDCFIRVSSGPLSPRLGASKRGGAPHLPAGWTPPAALEGLRFLVQLNIADFKKYDFEDAFPAAGIIYLFQHPELAVCRAHFEPSDADLVSREDVEPLEAEAEGLTFSGRFKFHLADLGAVDNATRAHLPSALVDALAQRLDATYETGQPSQTIFGRPRYWQGEDEGDPNRPDPPRSVPRRERVMLFQTEIDDANVHLWIRRGALKKGDLSTLGQTSSTS